MLIQVTVWFLCRFLVVRFRKAKGIAFVAYLSIYVCRSSLFSFPEKCSMR